jgi:hypothetical protein
LSRRYVDARHLAGGLASACQQQPPAPGDLPWAAAAVLLPALAGAILTSEAARPRGAAMRVWPALPTAGELVRLALPCPPQLIELSGYTGAARLGAWVSNS